MSDPRNSSSERKPRLAFVCPRLHEPGTVGGAETLLYSMARDAAAAGCEVTFLATCAKNHFTWANELPEERLERDGMRIERYPVNEDRDHALFLELQASICRGERLPLEAEESWMRNSVNSDRLIARLAENPAAFDRVITGPYLFGLVEAVARAVPDKTLLVPCLHDEDFARTKVMERMFGRVRGCLFNTEPERQLAHRLYKGFAPRVEQVVAMGIEPFEVDPAAFERKHKLGAPYVIYSGRREPLKGTPLLLDYMDLFRKRTGKDVRVVMTGSGMVEIPPALRGAVHDLGFVAEQEKREAMAGAVAFCHPSVNESLGLVLLEAWLGGAPALVHAKGAVLRDQCARSNGGLWFKDYPEFESELRLLLENKPVRDALGAAGRAYTIREYTPAAVLARFLAAVVR